MRTISIHALLTESDPANVSRIEPMQNFNPRSPHGERRNRLAVPLIHGLISIHALLTESDVRIVDHLFGQRDFNPRSPHGERPSTSSRSGADISISIHALLTESDAHSATREITCEKFQSTLSSRRATLPRNTVLSWMNYFNPRSPHGERPDTLSSSRVEKKFQSTLSSRRATHPDSAPGVGELFQSTLSSRRATGYGLVVDVDSNISIHALLTESDAIDSPTDSCKLLFQSTLSSRRATFSSRATTTPEEFQSTLSSRRATVSASSRLSILILFQSTLSSRRATGERAGRDFIQRYFNPRSPHGERRYRGHPVQHLSRISIHALLTESDRGFLSPASSNFLISIHALLTESDSRYQVQVAPHSQFQSTLSSRRATVCDRLCPRAGKNFNPRSPHGERRDWRS